MVGLGVKKNQDTEKKNEKNNNNFPVIWTKLLVALIGLK